MFLLDTNVISEVRKGERADRNVSGWYAGVSESHLFISSLTVGEIRKGIELARQRHDIDQAEALEAWLQKVIEEFSGRILSVDAQVSGCMGSDVRRSPSSGGRRPAGRHRYDPRNDPGNSQRFGC